MMSPFYHSIVDDMISPSQRYDNKKLFSYMRCVFFVIRLGITIHPLTSILPRGVRYGGRDFSFLTMKGYNMNRKEFDKQILQLTERCSDDGNIDLDQFYQGIALMITAHIEKTDWSGFQNASSIIDELERCELPMRR